MRINVISSENLTPISPLLAEPDSSDPLVEYYYDGKLVATARRNGSHLSYSPYEGFRGELINQWNRFITLIYRKLTCKTGLHHLPYKLYVYDVKRTTEI